MSASFELPQPDAFTVGAIGDPGQRTFFVQIREGAVCVSLKCEKQQVSALADYLSGLLEDLQPSATEVVTNDLDISEPVIAEWVVGSIGVAYDEPDDRVIVVLEELVDEEAGEEGATTKIRLTRSQIAAFVELGRELVAAGRPPCRLCGMPMDPDGHVCPRNN
jgi:uncharacterized repeat protein (TIGR03847 family)